jgi:hypothetical protein
VDVDVLRAVGRFYSPFPAISNQALTPVEEQRRWHGEVQLCADFDASRGICTSSDRHRKGVDSVFKSAFNI